MLFSKFPLFAECLNTLTQVYILPFTKPICINYILQLVCLVIRILTTFFNASTLKLIYPIVLPSAHQYFKTHYTQNNLNIFYGNFLKSKIFFNANTRCFSIHQFFAYNDDRYIHQSSFYKNNKTLFSPVRLKFTTVFARAIN